MIGKILDRRYLITEELSRGGFSYPFIAQDTKSIDYPKCLVKQFSPLTPNEATLRIGLKKFEEEARALSQLGEHPQVPRLLAYFKEDEELYIVQEYIEGHPLSEEIKAGHVLSEAQVVAILEDILEALKYVHTHNVIHRDIKPSNIMRRNRDRRLVLIDFGAVKNVVPDGSAMSVVIGTPGYMAPEQFVGKPSFQSDLYSLGIMCYEALTGLKFNPTGFGEGLLKNDRDEVVWPGGIQISPGLSAFLAKMVRQRSEDRYASAEDALLAVKALSAAHSSQPTIQRVPAAITEVKSSRGLSAYLPWIGLPVGVGGLALAVGLTQVIKPPDVCRGANPCLAGDGKVLQKSFSNKDGCNIQNYTPDPLSRLYCQFYTVKGKKGQTVSIDMKSDRLDSALVLKKPNHEKLAENSDISPKDFNAKITTVFPEDGEYLLITESPEGQLGNYSLSVRTKD
jgi:serine/threonine protein kinase